MKGQEWQLQKTEKVSEAVMAFIIKMLGKSVVTIVAAITFYLLYKGCPFFIKNGIAEMVLKSNWKPLAEIPSYGISHMVGATLFGSFGAMALAMPVGIGTALFLAELAPKWLLNILEPIIELLAGIPSIVYGMVGLMVVTPFLYKVEEAVYYRKNPSYIPSGGANLLAAILVLAVMILPTVIITSKAAVKAVPEQLKCAAIALGATRLQVVFGVTLRSASSGILTAGLLGLGRVLGETMAVSFVAGGVANYPMPFSSVRFLTTALVSEMGYAVGMHREALFAIGLILYLFVMILIGGVHEFTAKKHKAK